MKRNRESDFFNALNPVGTEFIWASTGDTSSHEIRVRTTTPAEYSDSALLLVVGIKSLDGDISGQVAVNQLVRATSDYTQKEQYMSEQKKPGDLPGFLKIVGDDRQIELPQGVTPGMISDGYHSFDELYDHRVRLFEVLMNVYYYRAWWSRNHADGSSWDGWIIAGIDTPDGAITYHLPETSIPLLPSDTELPKGKEWDGSTPVDMLKRLNQLINLRQTGRIEKRFDGMDELVVYHYSATINGPRGSNTHDGVQTMPPIHSHDDYQSLRAAIAKDLNTPVEFITVNSVSIIGEPEIVD